MNRFLLKFWALSFVISSISCSVGTSSNTPDQSFSDDDILIDAQLANARYLFLKSELLARDGRGEEAISALQEVNKIEKETSSAVLFELAESYLRAGKYQESLGAIDKAIHIKAENEGYLRFKAGVLSAMGRGQEAIDVYKVLIVKADGSDEEAFLLLSGLYLQVGNTEGALQTLEGLVKKNPKSVPARYYLAKLFASLKEFDKSEAAYLEVLNLQKAEPVQMEYVKVLVLNKKTEKAIEVCREIIKGNPTNAKAREMLGELLLGTKKVDEAIEVFRDAESNEIDPVKMKLRVAVLKLQIRDFSGAENELRLLLAESPENDTAKYYLATAVASQDRIDEALEIVRSIKETSEHYKKMRGFGAFLLREQGKYEEAIKLVDEGLDNLKDDVELLGYKVAIYKEMGELDSAYDSLKQISVMQPENDQHLFNLGVFEEERGHRSAALDYMEKSIALNPRNANALNFLGYSLAEAGEDLSRAEELIKRALEIEPNNGYFLDSLGWVYFKRGDYKNALSQLEKAVEIVPSDGLILMHLGEAYIKMGDNTKAKVILNKSLQILEMDSKEEENAEAVRTLLESIK
jgi:tetratricopeptide (TPR) repeat protein